MSSVNVSPSPSRDEKLSLFASCVLLILDHQLSTDKAVPLRYSRTSLSLAKQPHVGLAVNLARYETEKAISGLVLFAMGSNAPTIDVCCEMAAASVMTEPAGSL